MMRLTVDLLFLPAAAAEGGFAILPILLLEVLELQQGIELVYVGKRERGE